MIDKYLLLIRQCIPSALTMLNLFSGCLAILLSFYDIALAGISVLIAGIFDFLDGLAARLLNAYSGFGKELDSLADIVSFGVAPSFIIFHLMLTALTSENVMFSLEVMTRYELLILLTSFLPAMFTAIRLAKYNLSEGSENIFSGLPSPASGIFIATTGYLLVTSEPGFITLTFFNLKFLALVSLILPVLMVLPIPMFTLKFSSFQFRTNVVRYIFIVPSFIIFMWRGVSGVPVIILIYILISLTLLLKRAASRAPGQTSKR